MSNKNNKKPFSLTAVLTITAIVTGAIAAVSSVPDAVKNAIQCCESGGNYGVTNPYGYAGAYQFSKDHVNSCISSGICGKYGVSSTSQFLKSPAAQDAYFNYYATNMANSILNSAVSQYIGKTIPGTNITITLWGIMTGAHLLGKGGITSTLNSVFSGGSSGSDANGTHGIDYVKMGSLLDLSTSGPNPASGFKSCINGTVNGFIGGTGGSYGSGSAAGDGSSDSATTTDDSSRFQVENLPWYTGGDDTLSDERYKELFGDTESCGTK